MNRQAYRIVILGLSFAGVTNAQSIPQNIECGTDYTVKDGDYLAKIADKAYGNITAYNLLFSRNADEIGEDPNFICPGQVLEIPCIDNDAIKQAIQANRTTTASNSTVADANDAPYRFVIYDQRAPFLDEKSKSGGMLTDIVRRALLESDEKPDHVMHFVNDVSFIIDPLLVDHTYDMSVGITKPKCEAFDMLGEESQFRCNSLDWSEPLYEEVIAYYSLQQMPSLNQHSELFGKRICRPDGYTTADMDTTGVKEPAITLVRPDKPADCLKILMEGKADFAALATDVAQGISKEIDVESQIKIHEPLNHVSTVHVVVAKTNPNADRMLRVVDNGLSKLKESGEWFNIVRSHMTKYRNNSR